MNLRFYILSRDSGAWKRGTVFIKEIVPKRAISFVANTVYGENYQTLPMKHHAAQDDDTITTEYYWIRNRWNSLKITTSKDSFDITNCSIEEFISEHYWGSSKSRNGATLQYGAEHPKWQVYKTIDWAVDADFEAVYGALFAFLQNDTPNSVFLAEGSAIIVRHGTVLN